MSITKEQYKAAKKIVDEYEELERIHAYMEADDDLDDYDERDWEEEEQEREYEENCERASLCKCGAWTFTSAGMPIHIADCYCGAEYRYERTRV